MVTVARHGGSTMVQEDTDLRCRCLSVSCWVEYSIAVPASSLVLTRRRHVPHLTSEVRGDFLRPQLLEADAPRSSVRVFCKVDGCSVPLCCCVEVQLHPLAQVWWIQVKHILRLSCTTVCLVPSRRSCGWILGLLWALSVDSELLGRHRADERL
jgi:hypothetical protein